MMHSNAAVLVAVAIGVPWFAAILAIVLRQGPRVIGCAAALASVTASALLFRAAPVRQSLEEAVMLLFACLTLGAILVLPRRDCSPRTMAGILFLLGATLLAYSTDDLRLLLAGWVLSVVPLLPQWLRARAWKPPVAMLLSSLSLALAITVIAAQGGAMSIAALKGHNPGGVAVFALLVAAVGFRKGVCPAHAWVADAAAAGSLIPTALLLSGHLGAMLLAKTIVPLFPSASRGLFPLLSHLALVTALYVAIRSLTENSPRRLLAFLALSQSACILVGLESQTVEGVTGALVHWIVVMVSTVSLFGILRLLEVRFGENLSAGSHLGLAAHAPRLAVFFIVFGLALVGLPGTLSFCSQDLLIHGVLASHPQTGLLLPIATAMNAISMFRLFTRLFLGRKRFIFTVQADALPRERWALAAGVLFVILGGLFPHAFVAPRAIQAEEVEHVSRR